MGMVTFQLCFRRELEQAADMLQNMNESQKKLADMKGTDVNSFEIRQLIGEYGFVAKKPYQLEDARQKRSTHRRDFSNNQI